MLEKYTENHNGWNCDYKPFPPIDNRSYWEDINPEFKDYIISKAKEYKSYKWPVLTAGRYMDFYRDGNRSRYQEKYFERRIALHCMMLSELFEDKSEFIDDIIDLLWMICEETSWVVPAHNFISGYQQYREALADVKNPSVDLMAAETASSLALASYLLKARLDKVSPMIYERVLHEINTRILKPYLNRTDYWWMGFMYEEKEILNNWNPWINSNILLTCILIEDNPNIKCNIVKKVIRSLDKYLVTFPEDGCCDEGPSYWSRAGASTFDCLSLLYGFSNSSIDLSGNEKIKEMGRYIKNVHISDSYFINYADGPLKIQPCPVLVYEYGKYIKDNDLMSFGAYLLRNNANEEHLVSRFSPYRSIKYLKNFSEVMEFKKQYVPVSQYFYKDVEVFIARNNELFISAKGGHNKESHNHNDIGNFIVYSEGVPFIIDAGCLEYTKKTFSDQRYEIWVNQSDYHNVPRINGYSQINGINYRSIDVSYDENSSSFSLDIKNAYPPEAGVEKWRRSFTFNVNDSVITVTDDFSFQNEQNFELILLTLQKPEIKDNLIILNQNTYSLNIAYNNLKAEYEEITLTDERQKNNFGEHIYRLFLKSENPVKSGQYKLQIFKKKEVQI